MGPVSWGGVIAPTIYMTLCTSLCYHALCQNFIRTPASSAVSVITAGSIAVMSTTSSINSGGTGIVGTVLGDSTSGNTVGLGDSFGTVICSVDTVIMFVIVCGTVYCLAV